MKKINKYLLWSLIIIVLPLLACSADENQVASDEGIKISLSVPSSVNVSKGCECAFTISEGSINKTSDSFLLESANGVSYLCTLLDVTSNECVIKIPEECETGYYNIYVRRDSRKKQLGKIYLNVVDKLDFTPDKGTTIYGVVSSAEGKVKGVVVSDGVETTTTDENGIYQLKSKKTKGYVFISIPSNYEAPSKGILPQFYKLLNADAATQERVDFTLNRVSGQDNYKVFMLGDMHLANRTSDSKQFKEFTTDLNSYRSLYPNEKMYAITLGDMTWDQFWYSNSFAIPEYLSTMNSQLKDLQIFHTMGNHDNDYKATSDAAASTPFVTILAPTYYSFNIGKVHYVILDDIDCSSYDGSESRNYIKRITSDQLEWLSDDLSYINKSTPLVVMMHAQVFYPLEAGGFKIDHDNAGSSQLFDILSGYQVHFVTGHTHLNYNVVPEESVVNGKNFYEHNTAAVCGSWWWSGYLTLGVHLSPDGTPGGYSIWDISDNNIKYLYKATGYDIDYQFRSYDLNNVHFSLADVPNMPTTVSATIKNSYMKYVDAYPENSDNEVLINIWNWNPRWSVTVTDESGNNLNVSKVWAYDPLHIKALTVKRFNSSTLTSTPNFITEKFTHFFKVKAKDADTDLVITVKDEFGHSWSENMQRPKAF